MIDFVIGIGIGMILAILIYLWQENKKFEQEEFIEERVVYYMKKVSEKFDIKLKEENK